MKHWKLVRKSDLQIVTEYESESQVLYGGLWGTDDYAHVLVPDAVPPTVVKAKAHQDDIIAVADPDLVLAAQHKSRVDKLAALRDLRAAKLEEVDIMVNDLILGDATMNGEHIKAYRAKLQAVTDPYKKDSTLLDGLDLDKFPWPSKQ